MVQKPDGKCREKMSKQSEINKLLGEKRIFAPKIRSIHNTNRIYVGIGEDTSENLNEVYRIDVFFFEYDRSCAWIFSVCGIRSGKCVVTLRCVFYRAGSTSGQSIQLSIRKFECDFNGHSTFAIPNAQVPFTFLIPFSKCSMSIVNVCARAMLVMCCYFFALHTPIYFLLVVH